MACRGGRVRVTEEAWDEREVDLVACRGGRVRVTEEAWDERGGDLGGVPWRKGACHGGSMG